MLMADETGLIEAQQALPKIWSHPSCSDLVWGFTGDGAVGSQFSDWLRDQSPDTWEPLLASASDKLVRLNKEGKRLARIAGGLKHFEAAEVLIAGYLGADRESRVALISSAGGAYLYDRGCPAIAASPGVQTVALAACAAVQKVPTDANPIALFVVALEATIATIPALKGPVQVKQVPAVRAPA